MDEGGLGNAGIGLADGLVEETFVVVDVEGKVLFFEDLFVLR